MQVTKWRSFAIRTRPPSADGMTGSTVPLDQRAAIIDPAGMGVPGLQEENTQHADNLRGNLNQLADPSRITALAYDHLS